MISEMILLTGEKVPCHCLRSVRLVVSSPFTQFFESDDLKAEIWQANPTVVAWFPGPTSYAIDMLDVEQKSINHKPGNLASGTWISTR